MVRTYLNLREINGYSLLSVPVHTVHGVIPSSVFIGTTENPQFSALADDEEGLVRTARHVKGSRGPSGSNEEYLLNLAISLRAIQDEVKADEIDSGIEHWKDDGDRGTNGDDESCGDWYIEELERRVKAL